MKNIPNPMTEPLKQPVTALPGIGPAKARSLENLGITTLRDVLFLRPRRYLDFSRIAQPNELKSGDSATLIGEITATGARRTRRPGILLCEAALRCDNGQIVLVWFLPARWAKRAPVQKGERVLISGTVTDGPRGLQMVHPIIEHADIDNNGRIIPVYPLVQGLTQHILRRCISAALPHLSSLPDPIPVQLATKRRLPNIHDALQWMHQPATLASVEGSRLRLAYDEALVISIAMAWRRYNITPTIPKRCLPDSKRLATWLNTLPYSLTNGQKEAIADTRLDLERSVLMQRLLHGDVGSGKTTIAMYAIAKIVENGMQAALFTPTRILAEQHYARWQEILSTIGVRVALALGGQDTSQIRKLLELGEIDLVIGTHAILDLPFAKLGLVVVDEQHRFGVEQRARLVQRFQTHCLYLTATPIPRSLALAVWGDVDTSIVAGKPSGRRQIDTRWITPTHRNDVYSFLRREVQTGHQAYIVYPRIDAEEEDEGELTLHGTTDISRTPESADAAMRYLAKGPLAGLRLALLHGRVPIREQESIMTAFSQGEIDVLVCTTVIEVGVDVPNATIMVIEQAHMFGLAQLHQLRGRVGRGSHQSYCLLVTEPPTPEAQQRIRVLRSTDDGFVLAEEDLRLRGPGEVLGNRQTGYDDLQFASFPNDLPLFQAAQEDAALLMRTDPRLTKPDHQVLLSELHRRFPSVSPTAG